MDKFTIAITYKDVANLLSFMKGVFEKYPETYDECTSEDLELVIKLQIAWDNYQAMMSYTE